MKRLDRHDWTNRSVSWGTMRDEDLIPAFIEVLRLADPEKADALNDEYESLALTFDKYGSHFNDESREVAPYLTETLFDALEQIAPLGCYFGSHPGDGTDYGFWESEDPDTELPDEETEEELEREERADRKMYGLVFGED